MGCDIHMIVEAKEWEQAEWRTVIHEDGAYDFRSYITFAVLADVRNDFGIQPISKPRGLPPDATKEAHEMIENCHTISYLLLPEITAYPHWDAKVVLPRVLKPDRSIGAEEDSVQNWAGMFLAWIEGLKSTSLMWDGGKNARLVFGFDS